MRAYLDHVRYAAVRGWHHVVRVRFKRGRGRGEIGKRLDKAIGLADEETLVVVGQAKRPDCGRRMPLSFALISTTIQDDCHGGPASRVRLR